MYRIEEKEQAIRTVQQYLLIISQIDRELPHISVDGVYTDETENAVIIYQRKHSLEPTGRVDIETFDMLYGDARVILETEENKSMTFTEEKYPLSIGDSGNDVSRLNTLLRELSNNYLDIINPPYGDFFSRDTLAAIIIMQRIFRLPTTGEIDFNTLKRLDDEVFSRKNFKNRIKPS